MNTPQSTSPAAVLDELHIMVAKVLDLDDPGDIEFAPDMSLTGDLGLESIDLVTIGALLTERYGDEMNLAAFLAEMDIDDVIKLSVGSLVDFVVGRLPHEKRVES